ncbi:hypothetical protein BJY04DRAFT_181893 [Aspergillus karnatakaensis]|uniref:uncharacterized protein n=1 Tax=Aspergillus karnatakaensis TaxID=1810916 RepID=UPI003CCE531F
MSVMMRMLAKCDSNICTMYSSKVESSSISNSSLRSQPMMVHGQRTARFDTLSAGERRQPSTLLSKRIAEKRVCLVVSHPPAALVNSKSCCPSLLEVYLPAGLAPRKQASEQASKQSRLRSKRNQPLQGSHCMHLHACLRLLSWTSLDSEILHRTAPALGTKFWTSRWVLEWMPVQLEFPLSLYLSKLLLFLFY